MLGKAGGLGEICLSSKGIFDKRVLGIENEYLGVPTFGSGAGVDQASGATDEWYFGIQKEGPGAGACSGFRSRGMKFALPMV